jgi:hypothetical protein
MMMMMMMMMNLGMNRYHSVKDPLSPRLLSKNMYEYKC